MVHRAVVQRVAMQVSSYMHSGGLHCITVHTQGRSQDLAGEGTRNIVCQIWKYACRFARGFGGMHHPPHPPENFFFNCAIWCVLEYIWIRF